MERLQKLSVFDTRLTTPENLDSSAYTLYETFLIHNETSILRTVVYLFVGHFSSGRSWDARSPGLLS